MDFICPAAVIFILEQGNANSKTKVPNPGFKQKRGGTIKGTVDGEYIDTHLETMLLSGGLSILLRFLAMDRHADSI